MFKRLIEWMVNVFEPAEPIAKRNPRPQIKKPAVKKTVAKKVAVKKTTTTRGKK
jgi:hypothetical protein